MSALPPADIWNLDFDPEAIRARYRQERDKRIRTDGQEQYITVGEGKGAKFAHWLTDPWTPFKKRDAMTFHSEVVILGAGFSGLLLGGKLKAAGVKDFKIIDKAGDFGGTWYWNRYPGAACDSEAYCYLPMLEETGYMPSQKYCPAPEILTYAQRIARHFSLYDNAIFQTAVRVVRWDDKDRLWKGTTDRGDTFTCKWLLVCGGPLNCPHLPDLPGIETFAGHEFHTARWDYSYTGGNPMTGDYNLTKLNDKRVAIIGTGATGVQAIPYLGASCKKLYVFQRTPSAVDVRANSRTDVNWWKSETSTPGWHARRDERLHNSAKAGYENPLDDGFSKSYQEWFALANRKLASKGVEGKEYTTGQLYQLGDYRLMNRLRKRVDDVVKDKKTAEALKPWYNLWCKRPVYSDEYLPTFNRHNVELVDTSESKGIEAITPRGIVVAGKEYEVDCIIWSTGFTVTGIVIDTHSDYRILGRGGLTAKEKHAKYEGFASLFGTATSEFPNSFSFGSAQAGNSVNFTSIFIMQATWVTGVIVEALKRGVDVLECTRDAEEEWTREVLATGKENYDFRESCTPGYYNAEGDLNKLRAVVNRAQNYGGGPLKYRDRMHEHLSNLQKTGKFEGFNVTYASSAGARL
ncbi:FAD/NAD(P)-binding domain-containing protein [Gonapodya prolifera JEL478]|uniref:FAD/NAD(P)-binding domain-containing protein n=1 Tax=Gonapodya prolifera (strain JEL478) TaxID=1344416 RepID=A0A139A624_GONPJ|nr:FAD/NAD(P)-binding domain-containing protein [Gonapodya prolifera JEL478]|eukprot:KXS12174.1 FAD/NAD(P)-binding domain-containing protein [Gonapodya prolifera JEL478]